MVGKINRKALVLTNSPGNKDGAGLFRVSTTLCMLLCQSENLHSQVIFAIKRALTGPVYYALGAVNTFAQAIKLMSKPTELLNRRFLFSVKC